MEGFADMMKEIMKVTTGDNDERRNSHRNHLIRVALSLVELSEALNNEFVKFADEMEKALENINNTDNISEIEAFKLMQRSATLEVLYKSLESNVKRARKFSKGAYVTAVNKNVRNSSAYKAATEKFPEPNCVCGSCKDDEEGDGDDGDNEQSIN